MIDSNYIAFGEKAVLMLVDLYSMTATEMCVVKGEILRRIIEVSTKKYFVYLIVLYTLVIRIGCD